MERRDRHLPRLRRRWTRHRQAPVGGADRLLERQGYVAAIGAIALPNESSVRLHEALGFVAAGTYRGTGFKLGEWIDVGLWQKDLAPKIAAPAEPLPFEDLFNPGA